MDFLYILLGIGIIVGMIALAYYNANKPFREMDKLRAQQEQKQRIERQLNKEIELRRNQYRMSSKAQIDHQEFLKSDRSTQSHLFAQYLSEICEENIPILTNMYVKANSDKKAVASEIAAYLYFSAHMLMKASELNPRELDVKCSIQNNKHDRDDDIYWNRKLIYEDIYFGKPVRAYWDPSGNLSKKNTNALIFCLMAMSDFIWEPHLKDSIDYDGYYHHALTDKSIDQAMQFQKIYAEANMQVALFMDMVASTAQDLNLI